MKQCCWNLNSVGIECWCKIREGKNTVNLCQCCHDEVTGSWCGCEEQHDQDMSIMAEARARVNDMEVADQWSFYCTACGRYTSGTAYYID